jgi:hypothetical protein
MTQTAAAGSGKNQVARIGLRVKNKTNQPLVLAYKAGSNSAADEAGNRYAWGRPGTPDASAQGIGTIDGARIDPRFQIAPGGTRDLQMLVTRFDATTPAGKSFTLNTVLVEVRGPQWQKVREYPVRVGSPGAPAAPVAGQIPGQTPGQTPANDHVQKASDLLRGLLGGK